MGQIEDLRLFARVVEQGSVSKAADVLNIAKSAVSRRLNLLEERYNARLINRSPGVWEITATGRELHQRAIEVLAHADEIENDFAQETQSLVGPLLVSVPREFGLSYLNPALMGFKKRYPDIQLMVDFDDRKVDLSRDNYDFAIRIATKLEPDVIAKQIGSSRHIVFASSEYLNSRGMPHRLDDLSDHGLLQFGAARRSSWTFTDASGVEVSHAFQASMNSNSGMFLLEAAVNGLGIARLPDFICKPAVDAGKVVPLLDNYQSPALQVYLIHAEDRRLNRRMRLFAEEIEKACAPI